MVDRKNVAVEKMNRAIELLKENQIDMWLFYSRLNQDPSLELMFNTDTEKEVLFVLTARGDKMAFAQAEDAAVYEKEGIFTRVTAVTPDTIMQEFVAVCDELNPNRIAVNDSSDDSRCDGLGLGLYKKVVNALGEDRMNALKTGSYRMLEELRAVKTPSEVAIMEECSRLTTDIYDALFERLHVGLSEIDVGEIMMEECAKRNVCTAFGNPPEYPLVLLVKGGMSHRKPNAKNICLPGDMLVIDFSIRYNGYTSDIARTMYFLKPDEEHAPKEVVDCANAAIRAVGEVMKVIKPGMKGYEVDAVGRKSIMDSGYPNIPHSVGHQVGLEVHDGGTTLGPNKAKVSCCGVLRKNEIYALEPTVLQPDGLPSAIIEDNVILTDDGCRLISKRQTALIEIPYREA